MKRQGIGGPCRHACLRVLLLSLLTACSEPASDEQRIADAMEQMQQAAGNKQLRSLMLFFHDGFRGKQKMNKADLQGRVFFHFRHNPRVRVYVSNTTIQVRDGHARVNCHLLVTGSQNVMPDKGRLYRVESDWRKEKGEWRVGGADWEDIVREFVR